MLDNFRDISKHGVGINDGLIFRSACPKSYEEIAQVRKDYNISRIIDLRTKEEVNNNSCFTVEEDEIEYIFLPIELDFSEKSPSETNLEYVYKNFTVNYNYIFKKLLLILNSERKNTLIHCQYGMDRTGIISATILLLCNVDSAFIYDDYMETGGITQKNHLGFFLNEVTKLGGVERYLTEVCEIDCEIITAVRRHLIC